MTNPTPHGQVPEALRLAEQYDHGDPAAHGSAWKAAVCTELRRLAALEAQIEALSGVQALSAAPVEQDDHQILAITTAYEQGVGKGHQAYNSGKEIANPYSPAYRCDLAWQYGYREGKEQVQRGVKPDRQCLALYAAPTSPAFVYAGERGSDLEGLLDGYDHGTAFYTSLQPAPQQEAQEPVAYVHVPHFTVEGKVRPVVSFEKYQRGDADGIYSTRIPLYTAPQPAPAPLSDDAKDAARYRLLRRGRHWSVIDGIGNDLLRAKALDAAIDAALAAQGGK